MFSGCTVPPYSKETELGSSDQDASPSTGKNVGIVLVPCRVGTCVPTAISGGVDISDVLGCHLQIFEAFVRTLLNVNLSLTQTLLIFLLCVKQTWMTQLILAISL